MIRRIIEIDEERCTGCGLCAKACHEGAIAMVNGKATLAREHFCDGLGDCLPACPADAIHFVEREAPAYDEAAVAAIGHLQAEAVMQSRRAGEQGAGQRGKGLGIAQAKAEHGAQADLAHALEPQLLRRIQQLARPHSEARGLRLVEAAVRLRPKPQAEPRRQRTLPLQPEQRPAVVQHEVASRNGGWTPGKSRWPAPTGTPPP